jgi:hypothetical protein
LRHEQGGGRRKYYSLTDVAERILRALDEATQSRPKERLENWKIDELVDIIEDQTVGENLRLSYSNTLHHVCSEQPEMVVGHERIQGLLWKAFAEPSDKVAEGLIKSIDAILPFAMKDEKWTLWVQKIYPDLLRSATDGRTSEATRLGAIRKMAQIARLSQDSPLEQKAEEALLEIWFSEDTDKDSKLGQKVREELEVFGSRRLFAHIRDRAKDPKLKDKAELLLTALSVCLLPK